MTWDAGVPDAAKTAKDNRPGFEKNWEYIETRLQRDHFFDEDANKDGHFRKMGVIKIADTSTVLTTNDPADLDAGTNGLYYVRDKTAAQAPDKQISEPFCMSKDGANRIINQLGFRAMIHVEIAASPGFAITTKYSHNCTIARTGQGLYTLTFPAALPTENYIVFGTAMRFSSTPLVVALSTGANKAATMAAGSCKITVADSNNGSAQDPRVLNVTVCGG